jgi:hypothetical protein
VLGDAPSAPTARRALDLAGTPAMLDRIARTRAKARAHVWKLIEGTPGGFPWLVIAGKPLTGWLVIDMDATLVTASSDKAISRLNSPACTCPCQRFATPSRVVDAWLGVTVGR